MENVFANIICTLGQRCSLNNKVCRQFWENRYSSVKLGPTTQVLQFSYSEFSRPKYRSLLFSPFQTLRIFILLSNHFETFSDFQKKIRLKHEFKRSKRRRSRRVEDKTLGSQFGRRPWGAAKGRVPVAGVRTLPAG